VGFSVAAVATVGPEEENDSQAEEKPSQGIQSTGIEMRERLTEEKEQIGSYERKLPGNKDAAGFGVETATSCKTHGFLLLIAEAVPKHEDDFGGAHGVNHDDEIPTDMVLDQQAVLQQHKEGEHAHDGGGRSGAAAVFLEALVGDMVEQEKAIDELANHCGFSREKISSVGQEKMRAKVRANSRLGT
jgi:hypothetical protein